MKYLDLLKADIDISPEIREKARADIAKQNTLDIDVYNLSNIIMEIGSVEYNNIISNRHTVVKLLDPTNEKLAQMETKALTDTTPRKEEKPNPYVNTISLTVS
jgi:hypothetical protein